MSVFNLSNSITELTKIRKLKQVELAWGEVRIVAGKRINNQVRHSTCNICNRGEHGRKNGREKLELVPQYAPCPDVARHNSEA